MSAEFAGADHHASGGSWDTATMVHSKIFRKEPPVGRMFGLVLLHGKKYSKSKGIGLDVQELLRLVPAPLIKYKLFKPDISENKEFDPSGNALIRLYDEYQNAANLSRREKELHRAEYKMALAYDLSTNIRRWRLDFSEILIYYQIYNDWTIVVEKLGDKEGVDYLKKYVENWIKDEFLPEKLVFKFQPMKIDLMNDEISVFANKLEESMNPEDIHKLVYSIAKEKRIKTSRFFKALYLTLISKDHGPRFGGLVTAVGIQRVKETLQKLYSF